MRPQDLYKRVFSIASVMIGDDDSDDGDDYGDYDGCTYHDRA